MSRVFNHHKGTISREFSVGRPTLPECVVGKFEHNFFNTQLAFNNTSFLSYGSWTTSPLLPGIYRIDYSFRWSGNRVDRQFFSSVSVGGVSVGQTATTRTALNTADNQLESGFFFRQVTAESSLVLALLRRVSATNFTVTIFDRTFSLERKL